MGPLQSPTAGHAHVRTCRSELPCSGSPCLFCPDPSDLKLGDDGLLIDGKTGRVVNSLGASRFDVAVSALRGDLDPKVRAGRAHERGAPARNGRRWLYGSAACASGWHPRLLLLLGVAAVRRDTPAPPCRGHVGGPSTSLALPHPTTPASHGRRTLSARRVCCCSRCCSGPATTRSRSSAPTPAAALRACTPHSATT